MVTVTVKSRFLLFLGTAALCVLLVIFASFPMFSTPTAVFAQNNSNGSTSGGTATNIILLPPSEAANFTTHVRRNGPLGGYALGVGHAENFNTYSVDTLATFQRLCSIVRVYRVTAYADLILHPSTCVGNVLSFTAVGTGHYIFYAFGSVELAQFPQMDVIWLDANHGTVTPSAITTSTMLLSGAEAQSYVAPRRIGLVGATVLGVARAVDFNTYTLDTKTSLNYQCSFVRVYRITPFGDLILHPSTCAGNVLSFTAVGTGHYVLYGFGSAAAAQNAPINVLLFRPTIIPQPTATTHS